MNEALLLLAIREAPALIARLKELFAKNNPNDPQPTDVEVIAAYESAFTASIVKDDRWLTAHPE